MDKNIFRNHGPIHEVINFLNPSLKKHELIMTWSNNLHCVKNSGVNSESLYMSNTAPGYCFFKETSELTSIGAIMSQPILSVTISQVNPGQIFRNQSNPGPQGNFFLVKFPAPGQIRSVKSPGAEQIFQPFIIVQP